MRPLLNHSSNACFGQTERRYGQTERSLSGK